MTARRTMLRLLSLAALAAAGLLSRPPSAAAQPIDMSQGGPITVTADNGLEWQQDLQQVIATGNAHAVRGNVTVTADKLIAHYRRKAGQPDPAKPGAAGAAPAAPDPTALPGAGDTGSSEIYRLEAVGDVHIDTQTDHATGDHATYDIDQAVLLMTGHNLRVTTPNDTLTSRDSMEYWTQKHMAVARGEAVIITNDGRRISADVLVAYTTDNHPPPGQPAGRPVATKVAAKTPAGPAAPPGDPLAASGKLQKVEAIGNVTIRTQLDYVSGDRGVYVPDTGIARVAGHVRITRGQNQLNGEEAEVNLKTNISRLLSSPSGGRVQGLVMPNDTTAQGALPGALPGTPRPAKQGSPP
jgi:lipopolysaccharide export system protein LptA